MNFNWIYLLFPWHWFKGDIQTLCDFLDSVHQISEFVCSISSFSRHIGLVRFRIHLTGFYAPKWFLKWLSVLNKNNSNSRTRSDLTLCAYYCPYVVYQLGSGWPMLYRANKIYIHLQIRIRKQHEHTHTCATSEYHWTDSKRTISKPHTPFTMHVCMVWCAVMSIWFKLNTASCRL